MIVKNSLLLLVFGLAAHIFNYFYHLVAARFLTPTDFGLLQSFIALNYFVAVFVSSYSLSIVKFINTTKYNLNQSVSAFNWLSLKLTLSIWFLFVLSYPLIKLLLHLKNPLVFFIFSLQLLFVFIPTVYSSVFLAKLEFFKFSLLNIFTPVLKLTLASLLLLLGFKVFGAVAALTLTTVIGTFISLIWIKKHFNLKLKLSSSKLPPSFHTFFKIAFINQLSLTSLYSADIILTRYYFPSSAGFYSAASLLARIIFFISASVLTVAFPVFTKHNARQKRNFAIAFILICLIGISSLIAYSIFPKFFIKVLFADKYLPASKLLPGFSLFIVIFSLFNLTTQFLLNVNLRLAAIISGLSAIFQIVLIIFSHTSLQAIIINSIISAGSGLTVSLFFISKEYLSTIAIN